MDRTAMINTIGIEYHTPNIEGGEYSYVQEAGSKDKLVRASGRTPEHFKLDIRFEHKDVVVLIETKQRFTKDDEKQLLDYLQEERALHYGKKIVAILANTKNDKIKVWQSEIDDEHLLEDETVLDRMEHYVRLFEVSKQNDREKVLKNTSDLNTLLHKMDIDEKKRSQFVGTTLLYIKDMVIKSGAKHIDANLEKKFKDIWNSLNSEAIRGAIKGVLDDLLDGSDNKAKKIELLQRNVLNDQKVRKLSTSNWVDILDYILMKIYKYIDADSSEGQDILNLFFIAFNKYTGKKDKNQAFTPDHIAEFMCRVAEVDRTKVVMDITCGSGSFLVQAMVKELADCSRGKKDEEAKALRKEVTSSHIYGIENEEVAYGLATTNMLIHGDGNSNIKFASCFDCENFIIDASPDIILMNPPYNAKPKEIPERYKKDWGNSKNGKEDPTKGMVFIHYLSDVVDKMNEQREKNKLSRKTVKLVVLLPVSTAIGSKSKIISNEKTYMLEHNTLDAVFTLPDDVFHPGASVSACCMVFTLGKPHKLPDGTVNETFFGYFKKDGFKKKKNLGRVEQFDNNNQSIWKGIESEWLSLYRNKKSVDGLSSTAVVSGDDEWLCEAYMRTDFSTLKEDDFQQSLNEYLAYLMKEGRIYES
ncbi:MAG: SAM-dependent DNA methyltransferase [Lachnospiraceae bacterium]|nr:SAM-dependent DNA methyltransferase [Lachnospiraceae bacterium]